MKSFIVEVTEVLKKEVQVWAESADKAKKDVMEEYMDGNLVLTADDYHGETTFTVREDT